MNNTIRLGILLAVLLVAGNTTWAQESSGLTITDTRVIPGSVGLGESIQIFSKVSHPLGKRAIMRVAATVFHGNKITTLPRMFDDGTHGDHTPDDGLYSLIVDEALKPGQCKIIIYAVDKDRNEIESEPLFYTIE